MSFSSLFIILLYHEFTELPPPTATVPQALPFAAAGKLVTFGIVPTRAATGYGHHRSRPCPLTFAASPLSSANIKTSPLLRESAAPFAAPFRLMVLGLEDAIRERKTISKT